MKVLIIPAREFEFINQHAEDCRIDREISRHNRKVQVQKEQERRHQKNLDTLIMVAAAGLLVLASLPGWLGG